MDSERRSPERRQSVAARDAGKPGRPGRHPRGPQQRDVHDRDRLQALRHGKRNSPSERFPASRGASRHEQRRRRQANADLRAVLPEGAAPRDGSTHVRPPRTGGGRSRPPAGGSLTSGAIRVTGEHCPGKAVLGGWRLGLASLPEQTRRKQRSLPTSAGQATPGRRPRAGDPGQATPGRRPIRRAPRSTDKFCRMQAVV